LTALATVVATLVVTVAVLTGMVVARPSLAVRVFGVLYLAFLSITVLLYLGRLTP